MRGKGIEKNQQYLHGGITPAYAGKSGYTESAFLIAWDHPRLCGEKIFARGSVLFFPGSPPPMRGKATDREVSSNYIGITPAYAGKSRICRVQHRNHKDHPRLCGEKFL